MKRRIPQMVLAELDSRTRDTAITKAVSLISNEYDIEIGAFDMEEILGIFAETIGPAFYNAGLEDARTLYAGRVNEIGDELIDFEMH